MFWVAGNAYQWAVSFYCTHNVIHLISIKYMRLLLPSKFFMYYAKKRFSHKSASKMIFCSRINLSLHICFVAVRVYLLFHNLCRFPSKSAPYALRFYFNKNSNTLMSLFCGFDHTRTRDYKHRTPRNQTYPFILYSPAFIFAFQVIQAWLCVGAPACLQHGPKRGF